MPRRPSRALRGFISSPDWLRAHLGQHRKSTREFVILQSLHRKVAVMSLKKVKGV